MVLVLPGPDLPEPPVPDLRDGQRAHRRLPVNLADYPSGGTIFDQLTRHGISWVNYHPLAGGKTALGRSRLGRAVHYTLGQWPKLTVFLKHGEVPLDNNRCENAIRPFVVGRKGWLFSDTVAGAKASANLFSLVETCSKR